MLKTPYVFLDTQVFVANRFVFDAGALGRVSELSSADRIRLVIPETTCREIKKKIRDHIKKIAHDLGKLSASMPALALAEIDEEGCVTELCLKLDEYLDAAKATQIPSSADVASDVLEAYFNDHPPFAEGAKKHQFLDAFALKALERWAAEEEEEVYVISQDRDLKSAADGNSALLHLDKLADLFGLAELVDAKAAALLSSAEDQIKQQVTDRLPGSEFFIDEADGVVDNIEVVDVELWDSVVQDVEDEVVRFVANAFVIFRADVSYWVSDNATYDSEDKVLIYHDRAEYRIEDEVTLDLLGSVIAVNPTLEEVAEVFVEFDTRQTFLVDPHAVYYDQM